MCCRIMEIMEQGFTPIIKFHLFYTHLGEKTTTEKTAKNIILGTSLHAVASISHVCVSFARFSEVSLRC